MSDTPNTGPKPAQRSGSTGEWLQDRLLRGGLWAAGRLPYERRVPAFGALIRRVAGRVSRYEDRVRDNIDYVWPDLPHARRDEITAQSMDNFGRALIEHFSMAELAGRMARVTPGGDGVEALAAIQAEGRPFILLTGHFGNHEALWACVNARGQRIGGLYRPMANPYINARYVRAAEYPGSGPLFAQDRAGMGRLLRHLKGGGGAFMLNDLYVGSGIEMDFLGRPAMTGLAAAELSLRLGAPIFPAYATRQVDGLSFAVEIEPPVAPGDPETMTAAFNRSLEARILDRPEQWFWVHRRWKKKWNRGKGMEAGLHPAALPRKKAK